MYLSYGQIEALLAKLHSFEPSHRGALKARLKHLKRLGFPPGVNVGSGKRVEYDAGSILKLLIAFELLQLGWMPEKSISLVGEIGTYLHPIAGYSGLKLIEGPDPDLFDPESPGQFEHYFIILEPANLGGSATSTNGDAEHQRWDFAPYSELNDALDRTGRRASLIDCTYLLDDAAIHLREAEHISCAMFGQALLNWAVASGWRHPLS